MSKKILLTGMVALLAAQAFALDCKGVSLQTLRKHMPFIPESAQIVLKQERLGGMCEVVVQDKGIRPVVLYVGDDFVLGGVLFSNGQNLSLQTLAFVEQEEMKKLLPELESLVSAEYGKGDKWVYFISDPDCPFCEGIKKKVAQLAQERNYKVKLIFFPLSIHPGADKKAVSFICEKRTFEDYLKSSYGNTFCEEGRAKVSKASEKLSSLVSGTPTFIFYDGRKLEGGNPQALEDFMR